MKNSKLSFWLLIIVGVLAIVTSLILFFIGVDFSDYYIGGFIGVALIESAFISKKKKERRK